MVRVQPGRNNETQPSAGPQQRIRFFEKQLVKVDVCRSLMPERVGWFRVTLTCRPRLLPTKMKGLVVPAADDVELLFVVFRIAIRRAAKLYEVGLSAKVSVVV